MDIWFWLCLALTGLFIVVVSGVFIVRDVIHEYKRYEKWFREKK